MSSKPIRILITSGGTRIPIDPVRYIGNTSRGRFGAEMATVALEQGAEVFYLVSSEGRSPFEYRADLTKDRNWDELSQSLRHLDGFSKVHRGRFHESRYTIFSEYLEQLQTLIHQARPHAVILCAAVSDYLTKTVSSQKVRTQDEFTIELKAAPKVIGLVKQWAPETLLVGFKLLIDGSDTELATEAVNAMQIHQADFVVANHLSSIQRGAHEVLIVQPNGDYVKHAHSLGRAVIDEVFSKLKVNK